jgi:hypothetical protein
LGAADALNAELLSHDSATLTLDRWCAAHRLASPALIVAERVNGAYQAPTDEQRQLLGVNETETIRYRRVRLICGGAGAGVAEQLTDPGARKAVLELADNFDRLARAAATPAMLLKRELATEDQE